MPLITLYARKEPTVDQVAINQGQAFRKDVVFYHDEECVRKFCHWSWHTAPPRKTKKTITLNCARWTLRWLPDFVPA